MEIRRAAAADLTLLAPLFDAYRGFYRQPSDPDLAERFLRERLERDESVIYLALEAGAGAGFVQLYPSFWSIAARRSWILNDLFVAPAFRGRGIGKALLERARAHAIATGSGGLSLATEQSNVTAQRLYEAYGWKRDEVYYHYELELPSG